MKLIILIILVVVAFQVKFDIKVKYLQEVKKDGKDENIVHTYSVIKEYKDNITLTEFTHRIVLEFNHFENFKLSGVITDCNKSKEYLIDNQKQFKLHISSSKLYPKFLIAGYGTKNIDNRVYDRKEIESRMFFEYIRKFINVFYGLYEDAIKVIVDPLIKRLKENDLL